MSERVLKELKGGRLIIRGLVDYADYSARVEVLSSRGDGNLLPAVRIKYGFFNWGTSFLEISPLGIDREDEWGAYWQSLTDEWELTCPFWHQVSQEHRVHIHGDSPGYRHFPETTLADPRVLPHIQALRFSLMLGREWPYGGRGLKTPTLRRLETVVRVCYNKWNEVIPL